MNVFQVAANDQSLVFLAQIFGNVGMALTGQGSALLSMMFKSLNTALLVLASAMVTHTTVMGVIKTSHEGQFLGQKWDSLWVPLRTVLGVVALVPASGGYCLAQVVVMWFIVQGVGAADMVWSTAVDYFKSGSSTLTPTTQDVGNAAGNFITQLFGRLACQSMVVKMAANDPNAIAHSYLNTADPANPYGYYEFGRAAPPNASPGANYRAQCGDLKWTPTSQSADALLLSQMQGQAIQPIVQSLEAVADRYVLNIINDPNCWNVSKEQPCTEGVPYCYFNKYSGINLSNPQCRYHSDAAAAEDMQNIAGQNFVQLTTKALYGAVDQYQAQYLLRHPADVNHQNQYDAAKVNGWIFAGSYYYMFAQATAQSTQKFEVLYTQLNDYLTNNPINQRGSGADKDHFSDSNVYPDLSFLDQRNNHIYTAVIGAFCGGDALNYCQPSSGNQGGLGMASAALQAMTSAESQTKGGPDYAPTGFFAQVLGFITYPFTHMLKAWTQLLNTSSTNPVVAIATYGQILLDAAQVIIVAAIPSLLVLGTLSGAALTVVLGTAPATTGFGLGLSTLLILGSTLVGAVGYLLTVGTILGIYLPLIPFILFTLGALGWMIAAIEAMVAAPLIAIGIISPGGHDILGRAEPAMMIMLNVMLRPLLMIFGMLSAMLLSSVIVNLVNMSFFNTINFIMGGVIGPIPAMMLLFIYTSFIVLVINKCFSLIHALPDNLLRFIGGHAERAGGEEGLGEMKGKTSAAGAGASAGAQKTMGTAEKAGQQKFTQRKEGEKAAKEEEKHQALIEASKGGGKEGNEGDSGK